MTSTGKELLTVEEVAAYLGVAPVTVYRWCREGRLPALKLGKEWRIRRAALDDFLGAAERGHSLVSQLRAFLTVPDHVIAIVETEQLGHRLDAAFFQAGEARGGRLVKFYRGERMSVPELRADLIDHRLDVPRLEAAGQFRFIEEVDPIGGRGQALERLRDEVISAGQSVWASFNWVKGVTLDEAIRQQQQLRELIDSDHLVIFTQVREQIADEWPSASRRRAWHAHRGIITLSEGRLTLSRVVPLPAT